MGYTEAIHVTSWSLIVTSHRDHLIKQRPCGSVKDKTPNMCAARGGRAEEGTDQW